MNYIFRIKKTHLDNPKPSNNRKVIVTFKFLVSSYALYLKTKQPRYN